MLTVLIGIIVVPHRAQDFRKIVHHEAIAVGEHLAPNDVHLPARDVEVDPVQKGRIVELVWQLIEQVRMLQHVRHGMPGVPHEHHGRFGPQGFHAPGEGLVGHVVLHDVDQGLVDALLLAGKLIKSYAVPVAHQADLAAGVIHKQLGYGDFTTGYQDPMGRELRVDVGFTRPLGAKFNKVVVPLAKRDQADQLGQLAAPPKHLRVKADTLDQQVNPLIGAELLPRGNVGVIVEVR